MINLVKLGSKTAKDGFDNELFVINKFNNWQLDLIAKEWLKIMNYKIEDILSVKAFKVKGSFKTDVQVQIRIEIQFKEIIDAQNIQVKLVSQKNGFNQIDKRWVDKYVELWDIPKNIEQMLKYFTGELPPFMPKPINPKRMLLSEFDNKEQKELIDFFNQKKSLIVCDVLKGRGQLSAEWMLVILKERNIDLQWSLRPMNYCLNLFGNGEVKITKKGNLSIGKITMQRKGGDAGRKSAEMLQFKIDPSLILN